ncbi:MAG TPA: response regulator transcription factor [Ktedonobacterales bacterium]|nr:response regulator transcription factor [Ktedonobacterales bacterium]
MPARKVHVVIADDDPRLLRLVARTLELEGYQPLAFADGQQTLDALCQQIPDLLLLDVMMPKLDGFALCRRVRDFSTVPIIMLTARGSADDKILAFDAGADDYLTKPFSVDELLARIRAVLRRAELTATEQVAHIQAPVTVGDMHVDFGQHSVTFQGRALALTPIEYRLLAYLAENAGRVVTQDLLLERVWGPEYLGESHLLQVNINRLRHKLEADPAHPRYLLTKVGIGYLLAAYPQPSAPPPSDLIAAPSVRA